MAETTPSDQEAMIDTMFILVFVLSISFCSVLDPLVLHPTHEPQTDAHLLECSGLSMYDAVLVRYSQVLSLLTGKILTTCYSITVLLNCSITVLLNCSIIVVYE